MTAHSNRPVATSNAAPRFHRETMRSVGSQTPTWPTQKVCARRSSKFPAPDRGHVARPPLPRDMNQHVHVPSEMPGARTKIGSSWREWNWFLGVFIYTIL